MHFSKTYSQLLLTLPDELRNSAIEYRQLKKLINELVTELESLGLSPLVLHQLLLGAGDPSGKGKERAPGERRGEHRDALLSVPLPAANRPSSPTKMIYELGDEGASGAIVPRLRIWVGSDTAPSSSASPDASDSDEDNPENVVMSSSVPTSGQDLLWSLQEHASHDSWSAVDSDEGETASPPDGTREVVIPLASDTAFFHLLLTALASLTTALDTSRENFATSIQALSAVVSRTSRPASARGKSDLYAWRAIFQMYVEAQVFESTAERDRGARSVEAAEERLALFARRVAGGGFTLAIPESRAALQNFLELNVRVMNLKKFQRANAEAARKILKKHAKRTALPLPPSTSDRIPALARGADIPHILVATLTETLMPVVPHIDDYVCLICLALAFKPIRLDCGHLFCVRCLVKMQKAGKESCPMCRAPTVVIANRSNVDHALINFMQDWFPKETKEKGRANEREAAKEEMEELGLDTRCVVM